MTNAKFLLAGAVLLPAAALAQDGDAVIGMCAGLGTPEACHCAADRLRAEIGEADYTLYEAIGADYLSRLAAGEGRATAWDAALEGVAAKNGQQRRPLMDRMNEIGSAHSAAIKTCGG